MRITWLACTLLISLSLTGCASISLVNSWKDQSAPKKSYRNFLVVGISETSQTREVFEEILAAKLRSKGVSATPSYTVTGFGEKLSRGLIEKAARTTAVDAVIATRVIDVKRKTMTEAGYVMTDRGVDSYSGFYGEVGTVSYAVFDMKPVEITTATTTSLETSLFDTATAKHIWSGTSNAVNPQGIITATGEFSDIIIKSLSKEGLLP